tara:strand:+ start:93615 stop:94007 length:393 start_codon:yes stop_codon:yes gene_type:complete
MKARKTKQVYPSDATGGNFNSVCIVDPDGGLLTTLQIFKGILQCAPVNEITFRIPDAKDILDKSPFQLKHGCCWRFSFRNDGSSGITLEVGAGGSSNGSRSVAVSSYAAHFILRFTNTHSDDPYYELIRE